MVVRTMLCHGGKVFATQIVPRSGFSTGFSSGFPFADLFGAQWFFSRILKECAASIKYWDDFMSTSSMGPVTGQRAFKALPCEDDDFL